MRFELDKPAFDHFTRSPDGEIGQYYKARGTELEMLAKAQVGKGTLRLYRSIRSAIFGRSYGWLVRVGSDNKIAYLHHEGTRPHVIEPRAAKTLRMNSHGKIVYAKVVHHPGTKPNRYLTDNLRKVIR
jgi:RecA-family ATPase